MCHARYEKPLKSHPLEVAKKSVETYSPSNAVALDLGKEVNRINHKIYDIKLTQVNLRLADVELLIFPTKTFK